MLYGFAPLLLLSLACAAIAAAQHKLVQTAKGLFEVRKFAEAESLLRQALAEAPLNAPALVLLGRLRATLGHVDEAVQLYKRALDASPEDASAHHALAKVFAFQQQWKEARASFEQSLHLDEANAEAWLGLGRIALATGDDEAAEQHYARSLELDDGNALIYFDVGVLGCKRGQADVAEEAFAKAAELNPRLNMTIVAQMFTAYDMLDQAKSAHEQVLEKDPSNPVHLLAYGQLCEALRDEDAAKRAYEGALLASPDMGKAHLRLGQLLTGTGLHNLAAVHACGLNAEAAKEHFRAASESGEESVAAVAAEALAWCEMEESQVDTWRSIVKTKLPGSGRRAGARDGRSSRSKGDGAPSSAGLCPQGGTTVSDTTTDATAEWVEKAGGFLTLPVLDAIDSERFERDFVNRSRPVVLKNIQSGFAAKEAWSWRALADRFGGHVVRASLSEDGRYDGPEPGDLWGLSTGEEVLVRPPGTSMAFSDFVTLLQAEGITETFYLEYQAVHQYLGGLLEAMIPLPQVIADSRLELLLTNLWAGKGGTTAVLHYDDYENLLCQIRGTKELIVFLPSDLANLYYVGRRKGKLEYDFPGKWRRSALEGTNRVVFSSSIRLDKPDFDRHPRLKECRPYRVTLSEGDVLYMPAYWHHEVRSHPDADGGNIAVNFWFRNVTSFADKERDVLGIQDAVTTEL